MALKAGTHLGTYEILAQIGAGGMGEVYRAHDAKLGRQVAIKVLSPSLVADPELLRRFEGEAKAVAALSHPNVLGIYDFVRDQGLVFAVMELLEGENLREKMKAGALSHRRVVDIAVEVAKGLGAAHQRGIIHRDVKPENIFVTHDGRVKILDFGLAKVDPGHEDNQLRTAQASRGFPGEATEPGIVMGTVGYMSPEQIRGEPAGPRTDVFAFGVVLYEMLSGQRPFKGATSVQTMAAILEEDPPELATSRSSLSPALEHLVLHCLEKQPEARFQSMKDIAFALENLSNATSGYLDKTKAPRPRLSGLLAAACAVAGTLLVGLVFWAFGWPPFTPKNPPTFVRLTSAPGTVEAAFFGPDGQTVYFSERINGAPPEVFVIHPGSPGPRPLGIPNALLLGVSPNSELAILRSPIAYYQAEYRGMLAQVGGEGGAVKEIQERVLNATWDGPGLATLSCDQHDQLKLEFPAGKPLLKADASTRVLRFMRLSRDGERLAVVDSDGSNKSEVVVFDRAGQRTVIFTKTGDASGDTFSGMSWGPDGNLWYSELMGDQTIVWALARSGRRRMLWRGEGTKALMDVSVSGRMLLANHLVRRGVLVRKAGDAREKEVSAGTGSQLIGLSADSRVMLILESPILDGGTSSDRAYLYKFDGSPAIKVGKGTPWTLSPDGQWLQLQFSGFEPKDLDPAITVAFQQAGLDPKEVLNPSVSVPYLLFVPAGAGHPFAIALPKGLNGGVGCAFLHPDGQRVIFNCGENGQSFWYEVNRQGGVPKALTPPGYGRQFVGLEPLSPDGKRLIVIAGDHFYIQSLDGGDPQLIKNIRPNERPLGWGSGSKTVYLRSEQWMLPATVTQLDLASGVRRQLFQFMPGDPSGILMIRNILVSPDGKGCAMDYLRQLSELYLVDGVR
jgi:eukaryotic-like serine/threonine-protein kinase